MYCIFINMRYYIYILLDDRTEGNYNNNYSEINYKPFYIGKGDYNAKNKQLRHLSHYNDVILENKTSKINPYKSNTIKKLIDLWFKPNFSIVFETDNEEAAFKVEIELINYYGRFLDGGILTNIVIGGSGGDTFTNNPRKEEIREKHSKNAKGVNNPMYGRLLEKSPSHLSKINGQHWNKDRKASEETKNKMKENAKLKPTKKIVVINSETLEEIEILTISELIKKYAIKTKNMIYRCIKYGGSYNGYYFRYIDSELVLTKTNRPDYKKPIDDSPRGFKTTKNGIIRVSKLVYYKEDINSETELVFNSVFEASEATGFNPTVIRRKCKNNNFYTNIFRYENEEYTFDVKILNNQKKVKRIDKDGNELMFNSLKLAAEYMGGKITSVLAVCKGRNKTYKGFKFEYVNK
jgi:hypothetical protein